MILFLFLLKPLLNLSFDGGLKLCIFDGGRGMILSTLFLTYENNTKSIYFLFFLHAKI